MQPCVEKYSSAPDSLFALRPGAQFVWWLWNITWKPLPFSPDVPYSRIVVNVSMFVRPSTHW